MSDPAPVKVRRALISVSDKTGLVERAKRLAALGVDLVSTGGTSKALKDAGLKVRDVADLTGFPEMMDGRVKTLHPKVHGGLLFRRDLAEHRAAAEQHGIEPIDLIWINLYPFEATVQAGKGFEDCIENIDIGGPAMLRAAAKNADFVAVCTDGADVDAALTEMESGKGEVSGALRRRLAAKTYARTGAYDAAISNWYARQLGEEAGDWRAFGGHLRQTLRYGENPHQKAAVYSGPEPRKGVLTARQVQGKELSYNNINDTDAAYELVAEFDPKAAPAVAIIKHANPCGVAVGKTVLEAYREALACDRESAFGGIIAVNRPIDGASAEAMAEIFTEVVIAPGADDAALAVFAKKKNLRLLITDGLPDPLAPSTTFRTVAGGFLVQDRDVGRIKAADLKIVTKRQPTPAELNDMLFAWTVAKHVKSNAIVFAKDGVTAAIGPGQTSRVESTYVAAHKAEKARAAAGWSEVRTKGSAVASEAFFPFPDGLLGAAAAGATAVIQPGGSVNDKAVIEAADEAGLAMAFTGMRHFRH
ncbi:MAG: bifunctional phosphoribosylaminoimidazolecarboxamide formyltransferase/IMP cyclohydrolase [Alphaproteobacteria bacterium]|nr:bifunctional phosphoribosylaminoimidazolecarboxamide formyltransferase/IMP cyclohydrolase [Alphaproteobacteria bacterium]